MVINVSVQYNGGLLPDIILLIQSQYHRGTRLNAMKRFCICSLWSHLNVLTVFPLTGGCSESLGAFLFFFKTPHYTTRHTSNINSVTLHYTTLHTSNIYSVTLHYTTLHTSNIYSVTLHYTTLHPRQLIGGLSESTSSSGQRRRARGRECRGTQGFCWGRRDLWRRRTRAKKRLTSYAR